MYLVFDTETTGLPKNYQAPLDDFLNWPRLVQLAWSIYDSDGRHWESVNYIIQPDGFTIPEEATKIHRISQARAQEEGKPVRQALEHFLSDLKSVHHLVAHNIDFDEKIVGSELLRAQLRNPFPDAKKIDTMKEGAAFCRIDNGRGGYKWPNLTELYFRLFQDTFPEAHDAVFDVKACAKCLFELKKKGLA